MISNSIYIKILKVKSNQYNKLFNLEKLKRSGLLQTKEEKLNSLNKKPSANNNNNNNNPVNVVANPTKQQ
jgi:hypothetical protein